MVLKARLRIPFLDLSATEGIDRRKTPKGGWVDEEGISGTGQDTVSGATGNDTLNTNDGFKDFVNCGAGNDITNNDGVDSLAANCFP